MHSHQSLLEELLNCVRMRFHLFLADPKSDLSSFDLFLPLQGYIKIARAHHGCGITTDPVYAVFKSARTADA